MFALPPGENLEIMNWSETHVEPETRADRFIWFRYQCSFYTQMDLSKNSVPCSIDFLTSIFPALKLPFLVGACFPDTQIYAWLTIYPIMSPFQSH